MMISLLGFREEPGQGITRSYKWVLHVNSICNFFADFGIIEIQAKKKVTGVWRTVPFNVSELCYGLSRDDML